METIETRYRTTQDALNRLKDDLDILETQKDPFFIKYHRQFRNSAIQSFEFSIDTLWKFIKDYLGYKHGVTIENPSPRSVFREASIVGLVTKNELQDFTIIIADRNLTSHTYNEPLAEEIADRLPNHYQLMQKILNRMQL